MPSTDDDVLKAISDQFHNLGILRCPRTSITDKGVSYLTSLNRLRELRLGANSRITDAACRSLSEIKSLQKLTISGSRSMMLELNSGAQLPNLTQLDRKTWG